jgi:peroxiredoxin
LGRFAPDFALPAASGNRVALSDLRGSIIVLTFWSAGCTWSRRADVLLVYRLLKWEPLDVRVVGIASNANEGENEVRLEAERRGVKYPILLDIDQTVAKAYRAMTTPHFFVIDRRGTVRYTGALDDATFSNPRPKRLFLDEAVTALIENRNPEPTFTPPFGSEIVRSGATKDWPTDVTQPRPPRRVPSRRPRRP